MRSMQKALHSSMVAIIPEVLLERLSVSVLEKGGFQISSSYVVFMVCFVLRREIKYKKNLIAVYLT